MDTAFRRTTASARRLLAGLATVAMASTLIVGQVATTRAVAAAASVGDQPPTALVSRIRVDEAGTIAVRVGANTYRAQPPTGCNRALWILGLNRTTLQPLRGEGEVVPLCTVGERATLTAAVALATAPDPHALVVLNTLNGAGPAPAIPADVFRIDALRRLGFTDQQLGTSILFDNPLDLATDVVSAIGVGGAAAGEGWWSVGLRDADTEGIPGAALTGQLVIDTHRRYRFVSLEAHALDVSADGSSSVDGVRTPIQTGGAGSGVQLVVGLRPYVQLKYPLQKSFYRLDGGLQPADEQLAALAASLEHWRNRPDVLIMLTTTGGLGGSAAAYAIRVKLAAAIQTLGGTPDAIFNLSGAGNYSLVTVGAPDASRPAPVEASPDLQPGYYDAATPIRALLTPTTTNRWLAPKVGGSGTNPYAFELTLARTTQPWPVPAPGSTSQAAAFSWWGDQLCGCGAQLRSKYIDGATSGWQQVLNTSTYPATNQFSAADFAAVKKELQTELTAAGNVNTLQQRLTRLTQTLSSTDSSGLLAAWQNVKVELTKSQVNLDAPDATPVPMQITSLLFGVLSNAPTIGTPISIISGVLDYLQSLVQVPERPVDYELDTTVGKMSDALAKAQHDRLTNLGNLMAMIYSDYGLLTSVGNAVRTATPGTPWYFASNQEGVFARGAYEAAQANFYRAILPRYFSGMQMVDAPTPNIQAWNSECGRARQGCPPDQQAFANYTDPRQWLATGSTANPDPQRYLLSVLGYGKPFLTLAGALQPPRPATPMSVGLLNRLTDKTTAGGLDIPLAEMYRHWGFDLLTVTYATRFERIIGLPGRGGRSVSIPCWDDARHCYVKLHR